MESKTHAVSGTSGFAGTLTGRLGVYLLGFLITVCTLGICFPFAANMALSWKAKNTSLSGNKVMYKGKGSVFFKIFISCYLIFLAGEIVSAAIWFITGTGGLVVMEIVVVFLILNSVITCLNYMKEKTAFENCEGGSYFDGTIGQLFWLALPSIVLVAVSFVLYGNIVAGVLSPSFYILVILCTFIGFTLFLNFFTAWNVEHTMTSGKSLTFKGKFVTCAVFGFLFTVVFFIAILIPALVSGSISNMFVQLLVDFIISIPVAAVCIVLFHFFENWKVANTETVPENSTEKNNLYSKMAYAISTRMKAMKNCFAGGYIAVTDKYTETPVAVKLIVTVVYAALLVLLFYFIAA